MGSGKTSFGRKLAAYSGFDFKDLDVMFEEKEKTSIHSFFKTYGENEFRKKETELLRQTSEIDSVVLSLGGGTPCFYDNMDWLLENGLCIYIQLSAKALRYRLLQSLKDRPLIEGKSPDKLLAFIRSTMTEREPFYCRSHVILPGMDLRSTPMEDTFQKIIKHYKWFE